MYVKLDRPYSKCGYCGKERSLWKNIWKTILMFLHDILWLPYILFQECIWLHLLELMRKIIFVTEKDTMMIRK